jgi:hypothetical protein
MPVERGFLHGSVQIDICTGRRGDPGQSNLFAEGWDVASCRDFSFLTGAGSGDTAVACRIAGRVMLKVTVYQGDESSSGEHSCTRQQMQGRE